MEGVFTINNFVPSNPNPRKFSKGSAMLDPSQLLYMFVQLQVDKDTESLLKSFRLVEHYAEEYPQAEARVAALSPTPSYINVIVALSLGEAREALSGASERVEAAYGLMNSLCLNLYRYRPTFAPPPSNREKQYLENFQLSAP